MEERLIANIIYKELFSYNIVFLQNIGFLALVDHAAKLSADGSSLTPPYRTIAAYHMDEQMPNSVDIVMAISQSASIDYQTAYSIYDRYIQNYLSGNILSIPYVMHIRIDDMSILQIDERMRTVLENQQLSPIVLRELETEPVPMEPAPYQYAGENNMRMKRFPYKLSSAPNGIQLAFAIIVVSVAALYFVYHFFLRELI